MFGDGTQTRSFCYVDDLIRGLVLLAESGEHLPVNIGNPDEFTLNELAQTVLRLTGSKSEIVHEALPIDDPQVRQPDITRARQLLGWKPEIELEEGLRRMLPTFGQEPTLRRRIGVIVAIASSPSACVPAAQSQRHLLVGICRTTRCLRGDPDVNSAILGALRTKVVRMNLHWGGPLGVAAYPTVRTTGRPAYDWSLYDRAVRTRRRTGSRSCSSIVNTPTWANRTRGSRSRRRT